MKQHRTQVAIVGAGPAGLVLGLLLQQANIDCLILERQSRTYIEERARAGLIEHRIAEFFRQHNITTNMDTAGVAHTICEFRQAGHMYTIDYGKLSGGAHMVYPQQFVVRDFIQLFLDRGGEILFEHPVSEIHNSPERAYLICTNKDHHSLQINCKYIAGCDGYHGICRQAMPSDTATFSMQYGIGWLAILAEVPSTLDKVIYGLHETGFAGKMPRTADISRFYLECPPTDTSEDWPDERIWSELRKRLSVKETDNFVTGPIIEKRVLEMRSVVMEPMQHQRLFLAGDAAHIITPVGAKGMNLAIADSAHLSEAFVEFFQTGNDTQLQQYSSTRLPHIWKTQEFSDWMLRLIHSTVQTTEQQNSAFFERLRTARLANIQQTGLFSQWFAERYVGMSDSEKGD